MKKMPFNWDKVFSEAHLHSWPTSSLMIQNANPSPSQGSRNIYKDDEKEILSAAKKHGYRLFISGQKMSFIKDGK